ncbi:MAG: cysteine--tRNA ligase, partial [Bosea sp. (in: a-proteobacteria)]
MSKLKLYNTMSRTKEVFEPLDPTNVRMYVCGPTVYDYAHIGNARPMIVFDVLFRLLRHIYGEKHVTYARNITDVDDKINARAFERWTRKRPLLAEMRELTEGTVAQFNKDLKALNVLDPTHTPRATDFVANGAEPTDMVRIIEKLVARGVAYAAEGHVLFSPTAMDKLAENVEGMPKYGALSKRNLDDMLAGARVDVAPYKRDPMDFVLWKPSNPETEPGWDSPWGFGRPGWHIECSAMAGALLGEQFDIHGGGIDLVFPHHENEIAQSCCAFGLDKMASIWMHNGFLQVEGKKMSKSDGNFVTIDELLNTNKFGGRSWPGEVLRLAMLKTHYRQPIDWTVRALEEAENELSEWSSKLDDQDVVNSVLDKQRRSLELLNKPSEWRDALFDDLNFADFLAIIRRQISSIDRHDYERKSDILWVLSEFGLLRPKMLAVHERGIISLNMSPYEAIVYANEFRAVRVAVANNAPYVVESIKSSTNWGGADLNVNFDTGIVFLKGKDIDFLDRIKSLISARL